MKRPASKQPHGREGHEKRQKAEGSGKRPAKGALTKGKGPKGPKGPEREREGHLPVSVLSGFLGAGKTTLLKHILESKHTEDGNFRCAVIVNDMAELNIDKALIDQTAVVQSDEVIAMQNGCVCCTLQSDLVDQIQTLAKRKTFDYMIIEASGVSEPSQIARLFADSDHDHKQEAREAREVLNEVARLDTCVTVVDCGDFFSNLETVKKGFKKESFPQLLVEQIEYANVIILNKTDLVSKAQLEDISEQVSILNTKARILTSRNSKIDVMQVVDTRLYKAGELLEEAMQRIMQPDLDFAAEAEEWEKWEKPCCVEKAKSGGAPCCVAICKRVAPRSLDSGMSQIVLSPAPAGGKTRHESRFGITSFLYRARRPFHPERFHQAFVEKFFVLHDREDSDGKPQKPEAEEAILQRQAEAQQKQKARTDVMGGLVRSKGFFWLASRHDLMGVFSQAGNVLTVETSERWLVLQPEAWTGTEAERAVARCDFREPFGDRRQDMVFIGKALKHQSVQQILDSCLLTDAELAMGVDGWKATMGDLFLDADSDEEGEEEEEEEEEEGEDDVEA